jgi:hypothetical protein
MNDERNAKILASFEELGEAEVRYKLKMNYWLRGSPATALAEEWLRLRDEAKAAASNSANFRVARSAKNAAWLAAIMAIAAAIAAIISAVIAYLALARAA